jgi:hypothetical protein
VQLGVLGLTDLSQPVESVVGADAGAGADDASIGRYREVVAMLRLSIGILGALAVALAPVANATPADDQFLSALSAQGITGDRGQLIADGHAACDAYGTPGMVGLAYQIMGLGMSNGQAASVIAAGMRAYCPEKTGGLPPGA